MSVRVAAFATLLCNATAAQERARETQPEPIRIDYQATGECPSVEQFERLVFSRTTRARRALPDESARTFTIRINSTPGLAKGTLTVQEVSGLSLARHINGSQCLEVATVLALATALAIDPSAQLAEPASATPPADAESVPSTVKPPSLALSSEPDIATSPPANGKSEEPSLWAVGVGMGPRTTVGATPLPAWGGGVAVEFQHAAAGLSNWTWGLEVSAEQTAPWVTRGAKATFQTLLATPQVCALGLNVGAAAQLSPCVFMQLGRLTGRGQEIPNAKTAVRFWGNVGALLRLNVPIGRDWFTRASAGAALPFTRYSFRFDNPTVEIHNEAAVTGRAALDVGVWF